MFEGSGRDGGKTVDKRGLLLPGVITFDSVARKFSGMSFKSVRYKISQERELMKRLGFVSAIDEDNNGKPVYLTKEEQERLADVLIRSDE